MEFVKIESGQPVGRLYDRLTLGQLLPAGISFPWVMPADLLAEYGFAPAQATPHPLVGVLEAVEPDGYALVDGVYRQTWDVTMGNALGEAKAVAVAAIEGIANHRRDIAMLEYSPAQREGRSVKRGEALAYQISSRADDAPHLQREAQARGMMLNELVDRVLGNVAAQLALESGIAATCGKKRDAILACTTVLQVKVLCDEIDEGWPE